MHVRLGLALSGGFSIDLKKPAKMQKDVDGIKALLSGRTTGGYSVLRVDSIQPMQ